MRGNMLEFKKLLIPHNGVKKIMQLHYSFLVLRRIKSSMYLSKIQFRLYAGKYIRIQKAFDPIVVYCHKRQLIYCPMQLFSQQDGTQTCFTADSNDAVIIQYAKVLFDTILFYKNFQEIQSLPNQQKLRTSSVCYI